MYDTLALRCPKCGYEIVVRIELTDESPKHYNISNVPENHLKYAKSLINRTGGLHCPNHGEWFI